MDHFNFKNSQFSRTRLKDFRMEKGRCHSETTLCLKAKSLQTWRGQNKSPKEVYTEYFKIVNIKK